MVSDDVTPFIESGWIGTGIEKVIKILLHDQANTTLTFLAYVRGCIK